MILRFLSRFVRGPARPRQLMSATILGSLLAFVPSYGEQPLWAILLALLLLVSGGNLPLAALVWLPARLLALVAMPVSFSVGRFLLDGPTSELFRSLINAPVTALLGFEYYTLTGGIGLALVFGVLSGLAVVRLVRATRKQLDGMQEGSERWRKVTGSAVVRVLNWLLGGDWRRDEEQRGFRVPVRVIVTAVIVGGLFLLVRSQPGPMLRPMIQSGLEKYNGATVDLERVELQLSTGRMALVGFAMADETDLDRDLFRTTRMDADVSTRDLLRKRFTIDRLVSSGARQGALREQRGVLIGRPDDRKSKDDDAGEGGKTLDDYIEDVREWKDRLAQVREWLEKIAGPEDPVADDPESMRERLEREVREKGWAAVAADHLREGAPTVLISELVIDGLVAEDLEDDPIDVRGQNLSTHPRLVTGAPRVSIRSRSGSIDFEVGLGGSSAGGGDNDVAFAWRRLATDKVLSSLKVKDEPVLSGGTLDFDLNGSWAAGSVGRVDLPLIVTVREAVWKLGGGSSTQIDELVLPFGLRGPIDDPRISFDDDELQQALVAAGKAELGRLIDEKADKELGDLLKKGEEKLGTELDPKLKDKAKGVLKDLFGDD